MHLTRRLTPATANKVGAAAFNALKDGGGDIKFGRSTVTDYAALVERFYSGKLSRAILDKFVTVSLPAYDPLWDQKNLLIMPHISSDDLGNYIQLTFDVFFQNLVSCGLASRC